ncbi:hypothetical protein B0A48_13318 [Cryoendolithus antarcticus]|uniref:xylan 1,4-beta-xylosidase n=1 Tax=Cryoendolithus antarcticus TaxID=1507870 RepID=A0A1V8SPI0_9PEZI|nr:hypothetical protein B0A48_13318 [Cryoendolithus antarcticus]
MSLRYLAVAIAAQASAQLTGRGFPDCVNGPLSNNTVCDTSADPLARATALIAAFTLQEKLNNTGSTSPGVPRLGLPAYTWWQEALHGVASSPGVNFSDSGEYSYATSFPQPILMGAAFDDELIRDVATVVSTEARAFNNDQRAGLDFWTPNINPFKDPRWGRGQETPGEDPFHLSSYVHALIDGLQGGYDPKYKRIMATCKHFTGYDMESWNGNLRYQWDAHINSQDLVEYYMPSFQSCARDSNVAAFMCSYNSLNGRPTCADPYLLQTILREHWGWTEEQQWVTSDCDAVQNIYLPHGYNDTREAAVAQALIAGTDVDCGTYFQEFLPGAYAQGLFDISVLDQALVRQYSGLVRVGYFDGPSVPYRNITFSDVNTQASQALALKAAEEGIALLKNDGALPMKIGANMTIGLVGDWANATTQMQGNYAGIAPYLHGPYYAANQTGAKVAIANVPGGQGDPTTDNWRKAWTVANQSDQLFYLGGIDNTVELEGNDRVTIAWTGAQLDMISRLAELKPGLVVVQMGAGSLDSSAILNNPNISALLWAGYPGQDGGTAIFNIITGKTAPAGRLPTTMYPANYIAQVPMTDMSLRPSTNNPGRTYQWYDKAILPFGTGMHYTNFTASIAAPTSRYGSVNGSTTYSIESLTTGCNETYMDRCPFRTFAVGVTNTGSVCSDYVTLGYLTGSFGPTPYPLKRLVAYTRLHDVQAGSSQTANLVLDLASLSRVADNGDRVLYPGDYALMIDNAPLAMVNFTLTGEAYTLDHWPQPPEPVYQATDYFVGGFGSTYGDEIMVNVTSTML